VTAGLLVAGGCGRWLRYADAVPARGTVAAYPVGGPWLVAAVLVVAAGILLATGRAWRLAALAGVAASAPVTGLAPGQAAAGLRRRRPRARAGRCELAARPGGAVVTAVARPPATAQPAAALASPLRWPETVSAVIAALMTFASLGGLFLPGLYRDNTWATAAFRGNHLATLLFAVPVLAVALVLARRGSDRADNYGHADVYRGHIDGDRLIFESIAATGTGSASPGTPPARASSTGGTKCRPVGDHGSSSRNTR